MVVSSSLVPQVLEASTAKRLVSLCMKMNIATGKYIQYTFLNDGKKFYAFFYWDAFEELPNLKEKNDDKAN